MQDRTQKSEQPTPRRIEKARREGQFLSSREFLSAVQFLIFMAILAGWGGGFLVETGRTVRLLLVSAFGPDLEAGRLVALFRQAVYATLLPLSVAGGVVVASTLAVQFAMTKMGFSLKKLTPDLSRLNPSSRMRDLVRQNLWALAKAVVMLPLCGAAVYAIAARNLPAYMALPFMGVRAGFAHVTSSLGDLLWKASGVFVVLGAADLLRQRRHYMRELRMSRQEVREEAKYLEGNPQVKSRIRRLRRSLLRRRMMTDVKKATAVVVNPTHYAVALRYHFESMAAPVVVAKGKNFLAKRIRALAVQHEVPLIENPPLAQALYNSVDVGQEIPVHLYRAVAEILAYVFRVMNGRLPG